MASILKFHNAVRYYPKNLIISKFQDIKDYFSRQPRSAYISNLETPILQSSAHTQATYVPPPPPIYAVESDYLESQKQHRNYPRQEIHGNVHSRQNYPTWKGPTTVLQQSFIPEHHPLSFHTSSV
ncbi:hypothetical protein X798_04528 [Onchocerca flexuosa]|uniref:Uncharacterized protein n=1 Tax=Onchocerca flexuosa TaxID=387005 RepID=A0A238BSX6_9BILA|nr:hypothetical protein X798_04528 [Onchocerca flexuosa]